VPNAVRIGRSPARPAFAIVEFFATKKVGVHVDQYVRARSRARTTHFTPPEDIVKEVVDAWISDGVHSRTWGVQGVGHRAQGRELRRQRYFQPRLEIARPAGCPVVALRRDCSRAPRVALRAEGPRVL
jgi:hypothetical protein